MTALPSALARQLPRFGEAGAEFARYLPRRVKALARRWRLRVGPPYEPGGVTSWTAPAIRRSDRRPVVLKVVVPHDEAAAEPVGLAAWDGRGAVRLLEHDPGSWALLLERLGPATLDDLPPAGRLTPLVDILADLWSVEPPAEVPTLAEHATTLAERLAERPVDSGWDPGVVRQAIVTLRGAGAGTPPRGGLAGHHPRGDMLARGGGWA
ncbi:MAG: aminoglycoside phosphotransferase family protein, partial [Acidimicrobiia bacterium]